jgi:peptidoglycan/xylan/chitin deacetylase (PgdA/CDA1 family)
MQRMLLIYSDKSSSRLLYVLDFVFSGVAGLVYEHTSDLVQYKNFDGIKINYSAHPIDENEFFLFSTSFLFENDLISHKVNILDFEETKALFPSQTHSDLPFDLFSAVFYMLSRYEEYQPYIKDKHGRFKPTDSISYKNGFLKKPVVDIWIISFIEKLNKKFGVQLTSASKKYKFINTIDIDIAYSYKLKGIYRNIYGYLRSLKNVRFSEVIDRTRVVTGLNKDPFDTYDYILSMLQKYNLNTIFFVHVGDYGTYDKNIPYKNNKFRDLIRHLSDYAEIGIHPSYESAIKPEKVQIEIERLSEIIKKDITKSRQHFLKLTFPKTYRCLTDNRIKDDYSLGYASEVGFRAGTCTPFKFFDLDTNTTTSLVIHPFSIMEGTLKDYQNKNQEEALQCIAEQIAEIRNVNGEFISLWHNESLSNAERWVGWNQVYEKMINLAL